jgi:hypothetical protein
VVDAAGLVEHREAMELATEMLADLAWRDDLALDRYGSEVPVFWDRETLWFGRDAIIQLRQLQFGLWGAK